MCSLDCACCQGSPSDAGRCCQWLMGGRVMGVWCLQHSTSSACWVQVVCKGASQDRAVADTLGVLPCLSILLLLLLFLLFCCSCFYSCPGLPWLSVALTLALLSLLLLLLPVLAPNRLVLPAGHPLQQHPWPCSWTPAGGPLTQTQRQQHQHQTAASSSSSSRRR